MLRFKYFIELNTGYKETGFLTDNTDMEFIVEAKNRVTADRMVKAMLTDASNVKDISGICID